MNINIQLYIKTFYNDNLHNNRNSSDVPVSELVHDFAKFCVTVSKSNQNVSSAWRFKKYSFF